MTEVSAGAGTPRIGRVRRWVLGARPRTLAAAAVPVAVGTAVGWWLLGVGAACFLAGWL